MRPTDGSTLPVRLGNGDGLALSSDAASVLSLLPSGELAVVPTGAENRSPYRAETSKPMIRTMGFFQATSSSFKAAVAVKGFARLDRTFPQASRGDHTRPG